MMYYRRGGHSEAFILILLNIAWLGLVSIPLCAASPMAEVKGGEFLFGHNSEKVFLPTFYIDIYETTNADYSIFTKSTGRRKPLYADNPVFNQPPQPVSGVSWKDASSYCRWINGRLPTEAEWEKAGGWDPVKKEKYKYPWGNEYSIHYLNALGSGRFRPSIVGLYSKGKSPYGLFDMGGNVWEWTRDWYKERSGFYDPAGRPIKKFRRVIKGGSWGNKDNYDYAWINVTAALEPELRLSTVGFRCVRDAKEER